MDRAQITTLIDLVIYGTGLAMAFGLQTWRHRRATGTSGFNGPSGPPGSLRWWSGVGFVAALLLGLSGPVLALSVVVPALRVPDAVSLAGLVLLVVAVAYVVHSQRSMGPSWRIGVDETERTQLVTTGDFALVRNPIFTAMIAAQTGATLACPNWPSAGALVLLVAAIQIQVRRVEEPYLLESHGDRYRHYMTQVGRFIPHLIRPQTRSTSASR